MRKVAALTLGFLLVALATPSLAQAPDDKWHVTIAPYIFGAAMNGTSVVAGQELPARRARWAPSANHEVELPEACDVARRAAL